MKLFYNKAIPIFISFMGIVLSIQAQSQKEYYNYGVWYYEYVNEIQMVMIIFGIADHQEAFRYSRMNSSMNIPDPNPTIYLFRNKKGEIIKAYNLCDSKISDYNILKPEAVKQKEIQKHRSGSYSIVENTKKVERYNNRFSLKYADVDVTDAKWGIIDINGNVIIKPQYQEAYGVTKNNIIQAKLNNKWGILNIKGVQIQPFIYDELECQGYNGGSFLGKRKNKYSFFDSNGTKISRREYDFAEIFWSRRARVAMNDKFGFIDSTGNELIPLIYKRAEPFYYNVAVVGDGKKYGMINNMGQIIEPMIYDRIIDNYDEKKMVTVGYFGFINEKKYEFNREGKLIKVNK